MYCSIGHDSYSRVAIDRRWINGSELLPASKLARLKLLSWIVKRVKYQRISMVEMNSRADLWPKLISQSILVRIKLQSQIVKSGRGCKDQRPR